MFATFAEDTPRRSTERPSPATDSGDTTASGLDNSISLMTRHLILSNSNQLIRVTSAQIAYVESDGSYSTMVLTDGRRSVFSFNLATFERLLETQLGTESQTFMRIGKCLIVNSDYIFSINVAHQELVLAGFDGGGEMTLGASREALKALKAVVEESIKSRRIGL